MTNPAASTARMLALALLMFPLADALARDVKLAGMGVRKCAEWLEWKESRDGTARGTALEWAQGFMAGHNVYARNASSVVADAKVLAPLLDVYCQKNPQDRLFLGVIGINQSLGGAKVNLSPNKPDTPQMPMPKTPQQGKPGGLES